MNRRQFLKTAAGVAGAVLAPKLTGEAIPAKPTLGEGGCVTLADGVTVYFRPYYREIVVAPGETAVLADTVEHVERMHVYGTLLPTPCGIPSRYATIDHLTIHPCGTVGFLPAVVTLA